MGEVPLALADWSGAACIGRCLEVVFGGTVAVALFRRQALEELGTGRQYFDEAYSSKNRCLPLIKNASPGLFLYLLCSMLLTESMVWTCRHIQARRRASGAYVRRFCRGF